MDPNATLREYWAARRSGNRAEAREYLGYLRDWLRGGGFEPNWEANGGRPPGFGRSKGASSRNVTANDLIQGARRRRR